MTSQNPIQAAVCRKFGEPLSLETLFLSPPSPRQARIKLSACAICHSDIIYMDGGWGGAIPAVFGHEAAGVIVEAGADCGFAIGDRVLATLLRSCGACDLCEIGMPSQCQGEFDDSPKLHDKNGNPVYSGLKTAAFAEQVVIDKSQIAVVPQDLPFAEASLLSCGVMTGWGAVVNTAKVMPGASVAVVGCGGVGLNCLQAAKQSGAYPILAVDIAPAKLKLAMEFGATHAINAADSGFDKEYKNLSNQKKFDYVFMAAGSARAVEQAASMVGKTGALILVGMPPNGDFAKLNATTVANDHQRILGSKMGGARLRVDIPKLISMHEQGCLKLSELINQKYPLSEINDAIANSRHGGALRNVIIF